jgi:hypothetical protein
MKRNTFDFLIKNCTYQDGYFYFKNDRLFDKYDINKNVLYPQPSTKRPPTTDFLNAVDWSKAIEFMTDSENRTITDGSGIFL